MHSENGDENTVKAFFHKWLDVFNRKLVAMTHVSERSNPENQVAERPLSLKIAVIFNWLNLPLFWLGILVSMWLIADFGLMFLLQPATHMNIKRYGDLFLAIAGPAAVGYWTNWLAIKMLFYPKKNNIVWWGLIPARKDELIELMAKNILQRLISPEIIRNYLQEKRVLKRLMYRTGKALRETINEPEFREEIKEMVARFLNDFFNDPLTQEKIYNAINEKVAEWTKLSLKGKLLDWTRRLWEPSLKRSLPELPKALNSLLDYMDELIDRIPDKLKQENQYFEELLVELIIQFLHNIDLKRIIKHQFGKMNTDEFEVMISGSVQTELVFIQTSGGIFGLLVGLAIIYPVIRLIILLLGSGLWVAYGVSLKNE